ncbi:MAG: TIGR02530 family flagellar biosynthesis protein [Bacillota bacterium]
MTPQRPLRPQGPAEPRLTPAGQSAGATSLAPSFASVLQQTLEQGQLKFSSHAQARLQASQTRLSPTDLTRINDAVNRAAQKGARESLILMPDLALVVSVRNKTVITAVEGQRMKENIFTNIDSAVIL